MNKACKKCNTDKDIGQFRDSKQTKDGKFPFCIECQDKMNKELYLKNKQKRLQQISKWNLEHPDKLKTYKSNWRKNKQTTN